MRPPSQQTPAAPQPLAAAGLWGPLAGPGRLAGMRVTCLLACGLIVATLAWTWQHLEEQGRAPGGSLRVPDGVTWEPYATLVARIEETWVPGDRLRTLLLLVGGALCAAGGWRAWRVEGLPAATLRRAGLVVAIVGSACLAVGIALWLAQPRELTCTAYLSANFSSAASPGEPDPLGYEQALGSEAPAGMAQLLLHGAVLLGLGLLLALASRLCAPRAPLRPREASRTP